MKTGKVDINLNGSQHINASGEESVIDVKISEVVLTPLTCASLVNEILKGLLYQRSQIPYPYSWLKSLVETKRRQIDSEQQNKPINFTAANHFRVVSSTYDILENIKNGLIKEFKESGNYIKEVVFLFGTTPHCPREVFTVNISSIANGHFENNHASHSSKYQQKILRNIFLSQSWMDAIDATSTCTNTYIYLKKCVPTENNDNSEETNNFFIPIKPPSFPPKLKHVKIKLNYNESDNFNCCKHLSVFEDVSESDRYLEERQLVNCENSEVSVSWYQSKDLLKGFKDCYVNKVSACELW